MNGLDFGLIALVIFGAFICWLILQDIHTWANYEDPFTRQQEEIRELPEAPFDWERDVA